MNRTENDRLAQGRCERGKLRAVVFGREGGSGMGPPLLRRFAEEFEIVAIIAPKVPAAYELLFRLISVRWPRTAWYRNWRYYVEKTPFSFRALTRDGARQLRALEGKYDLILLMGAMYAPGDSAAVPIFVFTDSCRWLSSRNMHDEISHFRNADDEREWLALEGNVYRSAARIFVGSEFVRVAILAHYGVEAYRVVNSGFGPDAGFDEPYDKIFDGRTILYIGKGDFEKKGGVLLMKAFEHVRRQIPGAALHVVGQERLPLADGVINHGFIRDRQRLMGLMRAAHVFALPSFVDRNPISILEAMAASTPCVASDYGAMPELVGNAGLIAPCGDVAALVESIVRILRDETLAREMGAAGRIRYQQRYNWDAIWQVIRTEMWSVLGHDR